MFPIPAPLPFGRLAALAALLALLLAQALPWPAAVKPAGASGPNAVQSAAINAGQKACPHHPQGCPRDCLCPQVQDDTGADGSGTLMEASLVRCTAHGDPITPEVPGISLPGIPLACAFPIRIQRLRFSAPASARAGFLSRPGKIPIA